MRGGRQKGAPSSRPPASSLLSPFEGGLAAGQAKQALAACLTASHPAFPAPPPLSVFLHGTLSHFLFSCCLSPPLGFAGRCALETHSTRAHAPQGRAPQPYAAPQPTHRFPLVLSSPQREPALAVGTSLPLSLPLPRRTATPPPLQFVPSESPTQHSGFGAPLIPSARRLRSSYCYRYCGYTTHNTATTTATLPPFLPQPLAPRYFQRTAPRARAGRAARRGAAAPRHPAPGGLRPTAGPLWFAHRGPPPTPPARPPAGLLARSAGCPPAPARALLSPCPPFPFLFGTKKHSPR